MKTWNKPVLTILDVKATQSGGTNLESVDRTWQSYDAKGNPITKKSFNPIPS